MSHVLMLQCGLSSVLLHCLGNIMSQDYGDTKKHKASFCEEHILHKSSKTMHGDIIHYFKIENRTRKVASMLAQSMTKTEIAVQTSVERSYINRYYTRVAVVDCSVQRFFLVHYVRLKKRLMLLLHLAVFQGLQARPSQSLSYQQSTHLDP